MKIKLLLLFVLAICVAFSGCAPRTATEEPVPDSPKPTPYDVVREEEPVQLIPTRGHINIATDSMAAYDLIFSLRSEASQQLNYNVTINYYDREALSLLVSSQHEYTCILVEDFHPLLSSPNIAFANGIFEQRYVLLGGEEAYSGMLEAFSNIAQQKLPYVASEENSPIRPKEEQLWSIVGEDIEEEDWFFEEITEDTPRDAYALSCMYEHVTRQEEANVAVQDDPYLLTDFLLAGLNSATPEQQENVQDFSEWFLTEKTAALVNNYGIIIYGHPLFSPIL